MTEILIKKLSKKVTLPKYETDGSSGLDLAAFVDKNIEIKPGKSNIIPTGLAAKNQISVLNTPGTIDADYRGELKIILINLSNKSFIVEKGLRIAQMVLCPVVKAKFKEVESLDDTKRGSGGFGSTGAK